MNKLLLNFRTTQLYIDGGCTVFTLIQSVDQAQQQEGLGWIFSQRQRDFCVTTFVLSQTAVMMQVQ